MTHAMRQCDPWLHTTRGPQAYHRVTSCPNGRARLRPRKVARKAERTASKHLRLWGCSTTRRCRPTAQHHHCSHHRGTPGLPVLPMTASSHPDWLGAAAAAGAGGARPAGEVVPRGLAAVALGTWQGRLPTLRPMGPPTGSHKFLRTAKSCDPGRMAEGAGAAADGTGARSCCQAGRCWCRGGGQGHGTTTSW